MALTPSQKAFATSKAQFPAFVGGFGSGKTAAAIARVMALKIHCRQEDIAYYLPTYPLVEDIAFKRFPELCERKNWAYKLNRASAYIEFPGAGRVLFRTMERPERIVGYEVAHSICDELDTLTAEKAKEVWNKVIARNRQKCRMANTVAVATTPEGFRFVYERWVKAGGPDYVLFKAKTEENAHNLPPGYIDSLRATYPSSLLSAYLDGEFVNLAQGSVYAEFDRKENRCDTKAKQGETLHVGMDFNVGKGAAVLFVLRDDEPHAIAELSDVFDTPAMCVELSKYKSQGHPIFVYPDASGNARKSQNASVSDLAILRQAGFTVLNNPSNPAVRDRVLSVNRLIYNSGQRKLKVNPDTCPGFVETLEKQAYNKHGEPDKSSGLDHLADAGGYFLSYKYPIRSAASQRMKLLGL